MGGMSMVPTLLAGLYEIHGTSVSDTRGRFTRLFCEQEFAAIRPGLHFSQINLSHTAEEGSVRGMHFQLPPATEAKLVRCLAGRIFDVAVDVRAGSPTFLQWHATELTGDTDRALFIPEGFAHGFQTLTDNVQVLYMHTAPWTPATEAGLPHNDPSIGITWPRPITRVSDRDRSFLQVGSQFSGVEL